MAAEKKTFIHSYDLERKSRREPCLHPHKPPLVQELVEPINSRVLCPLKTSLLLGVLLVASGSKAVDQTGVVIVVERNVQRGQSLEGKLLQLGGEHGIGLGDDEAGGHSDALDLWLLEQRRVGDDCGVDEGVLLAGEAQDGPGAPAETDGADFGVLALELLCAGRDFGVALVFAVAAEEGHDVEFVALFGVLEGVGLDDFAVEAVRVVRIS